MYLYLLAILHHSTISTIQWFGFLSLLNLYLSLIISPLYVVFPSIPYKNFAIIGRQAFGICACIYACIHAYIGFFGFIGGFTGLSVWSTKYRFSIVVGTVAIVILLLLTITSYSSIKKYMGIYWKKFHRTVYVCAILILIHSVTVTIHLFHLTEIMIAAYIAIVFLLLLEALRFEKFLRKKGYMKTGHYITRIIFPLCSAILFWSFFGISHHTH